MPTRNINLTEHFDEFISAQIKAGQYRNASEVMRAGLRLLEHQNREEREKLKLLRALASEAFTELDQGRGTEIRNERQLADLIRRAGRRAVSNKRTRRGA